MARTKDFTQLKALLESQETFPTDYLHKFIGRNTPAFVNGVNVLEQQFPKLKLKHSRMSSGDANVALTYVFNANSADEIIALLQVTDNIDDVVYVL